MDKREEIESIFGNATLEDDAGPNLFEEFAPSAPKVESGKNSMPKPTILPQVE